MLQCPEGTFVVKGVNSYRFVAVNAAQFIVGGFTLPLVAKFASGHDRQYGWRMTITIWAVLCLVLFLITFATTRERIHSPKPIRSSPKQDFLGLLQNGPWKMANVFNSISNMLGTGLIMVVILLSPPLACKFGKKAVSTAGFALATVGTLAFYLLSPTNIWAILGLTAFISIVYAPTIPLTWAIFADVADYSEWKLGRRFTGMVFATIGFSLKSGLALGSASFLWIMQAFFHCDTKLPSAADAVAGYRFTSGIAVGLLFAICALLLLSYPPSKLATIQKADELAERRKRNEPQPVSA